MNYPVNTRIRFFVRWSDTERAGTITRIVHNIVWVNGDFCYHVDDLSRVRKVTP